MTDDSINKNLQEKYVPDAEDENSAGAEIAEIRSEAEYAPDRFPESPETSIERELTYEREKLDVESEKLAPQEHEKARAESVNIQRLTTEGKVDRLVRIAEEKGLLFAFGTAKKLDDAQTLDRLHDYMEKDGNYKRFRM